MNQADVNLLNSPLGTSEFPLLESITLVNDGPTVVLKSGLFSQASLLTSFTVLDFTEDDLVDFGCYDDALPWHQLREVRTQSDIFNLSGLNDEFEDGNNRTLVLRPQFHRGPSLPYDDAPSSHRVSTLVLDSIVWSSSLSDFFQSVTIPTLQCLTMMPPDRTVTFGPFVPPEWNDPFSALPEFFDRSGCALQTLSLIIRGQYKGGTSTMQPTLADSRGRRAS